MSALDDLRAEFARVAEQEAQRPPRRWRPWRGGSSLLAVGAVLGVGATVALAASGVLTGEPVKNPAGVKFDPDAGVGAPQVDSSELLPLRVADPDGGPPWGLRRLTTTRGFVCVQLGRVVDDKLGVLGRSGAFGNDGLFHERASDVVAYTDCQLPDGAGRTFLAMRHYALPDSADPRSCVIRQRPGGPRQPFCPRAGLRRLQYGLLGPQGAAVTYDDGGRTKRSKAVGPDGAFLVVQRLPRDSRASIAFTSGVTPSTGLKTVEYRNGSTCKILDPRRLRGARPCPLKGYTPRSDPRIPSSQLRAEVTVRLVGKPRLPPIPRAERARIPKGTKLALSQRIEVAFRAPVAGDAFRFYTLGVQMKPSPRHASGCTYTTGGAIPRDIEPGELVRETREVSASCGGSVRVEVGFVQSSRPQGLPFGGAPGRGGIATVGSAEIAVPRVRPVTLSP